MSIAHCSACDWHVDTDYDDEFYVDPVSSDTTGGLCQICRENRLGRHVNGEDHAR